MQHQSFFGCSVGRFHVGGLVDLDQVTVGVPDEGADLTAPGRCRRFGEQIHAHLA